MICCFRHLQPESHTVCSEANTANISQSWGVRTAPSNRSGHVAETEGLEGLCRFFFASFSKESPLNCCVVCLTLVCYFDFQRGNKKRRF